MMSVLPGLSVPLPGAVTPELVTDIATNEQGTNISAYVPMGSYVLFQGVDLAHGHELWRSDGTPWGTSLLKDIWPGPTTGASSNMARAGNLCFFSANSGNYPEPGSELWKSDGTAAGTVLVKDINPAGYSSPSFITAWGNRVVFQADDGTHGKELWVSDGTEAGTTLVADLSPGTASTGFDSAFYRAAAVGEDLYFPARISGASLAELWKTDGTPGGTSPVGEGLFHSPTAFELFSGSLYIVARDAVTAAPGLWRVNPAGPSIVKLATMGDSSYAYNASLEVLGGSLYFTKPLGYASTELWKTNGTVATTSLVKTLGRAGGLTHMSGLSGRAGEALYFSNSTPETGVELWVSNGTSAGTVQLREINPGSGDSYPGSFVQVGMKAYFRADRGDSWRHLWITDGSTAGTTLLKEFTSSIGAMAAAGNRLVFSGTDATYGKEMWASQGTAPMTYLVRNFAGTSSSEPSAFLNVGSRLFFTAKPAGWRHLMVTDGTAEGTRETGQSSPYTNHLSGGAALGNHLIYGSEDLNDHYDLYKTDGTVAGTVKVKEIYPAGNAAPRAFVGMDGYVLFSADDGVNGRELWRSDGTDAGTTLVKDVVAGSTGSDITEIIRAGPLAFFRHYSGLWRTDGTGSGTSLLNVGPPSIANLISNGALAFYTAQHDFQFTGLWRSDGTVAGTYRIALLPTSFVTPNLSYFRTIASAGGLVYLAGPGQSGNGMELWRSDGTGAGTFRILQSSATLSQSAQGLASFGQDLVFWLKTPAGYALWRSDGTSAGTRMVREIPALEPGQEFDITEQIVAGGKIWFLSGDEKNGYTLWKSDGTLDGTGRVDLIGMPAAWKYNTSLWTAGDYLLFPLETDAYGLEMFRLPLDGTTNVVESWTSWLAGSGLGGSQSDPNAAPHGEGVANLLKYAFFLDGTRSDVTPLAPGTGVKGLPAVTLEDRGETKVLRVEYLRRKGGGLTYVAKVSGSLGPASFVPMGGTRTIVPVDDLRERVIHEQPVNAATDARLFGIVEVTGP